MRFIEFSSVEALYPMKRAFPMDNLVSVSGCGTGAKLEFRAKDGTGISYSTEESYEDVMGKLTPKVMGDNRYPAPSIVSLTTRGLL